ncbi:hypothetical protein EF909_19725 [Streptomyces sp. WAC01280]|nr:hypothetical protein EF909_19725 [Streptomyces sp. WAC01280]
MPVLAWPMTSVPVRATGRVISWMGKGVTMPTASRASAVSGRIPSSRKVVVRVLPLLWTRGEANDGGRTVPGTSGRIEKITAGWHGTTAVARASYR